MAVSEQMWERFKSLRQYMEKQLEKSGKHKKSGYVKRNGSLGHIAAVIQVLLIVTVWKQGQQNEEDTRGY